MLKRHLATIALPLFASCVIEQGARPTIDADLQVVTEDVHRGMVQTENGALIPGTVISLPAKEDGTILIVTEGSLELSDDTGDAWRPDGHSGRFGRFDWSVLYEQPLEHVLLTFGLINYNLPNGLEFPFGERGATSELLFEASTDFKGVNPWIRFNYDFDEVDGLYLQLGVGKRLALADKWDMDLDVSLGWMDDNQSDWNYAQVPEASGFADARATGTATYTIDQNTSAHVELGLSQIVDGDFRDWFDILGIDATQVWLGIGMHWSY